MKSKTENPLLQLRQKGVPLAAFETNDTGATMADCLKLLNGKSKETAVVCWDIVQGWIGLNDVGSASLDWYDKLAQSFPETLQLLGDNCSEGTVAFVMNPNRFMERDGVAQAFSNLRDVLKRTDKRAILVLLGASVTLPMEIANDVIVWSETAPDGEVIGGIVERIYLDAVKGAETSGVKLPDLGDKRVSAVAGLKGLLSKFDVEQTFSLSIQRDGVNVPNIWERKIERVKKMTGAEITLKNPGREKLCGCNNIWSEIEAFIGGRQRPALILHQDEIEKSFAGAGTSLDGTTSAMVGQWLTYTQERRVRGFLLAGVPGSGKSWTAAIAAGFAGVPLFKLNIAETKGSLVGQSEQQMKMALQAVDALSDGGNVLMLNTCNWVDQLTPDVMSRHQMGTFFYDFPTDAEVAALLDLYLGQYGLTDKLAPLVELMRGWVGREVENACFKAYQYNRPVAEVAKNIAPSCVSQKTKLTELRKSCSGRFISASQPGVYQYRELGTVNAGGRAITF